MSNIPIYVASRASIPERSAMWRQLRSEGWNIISSWIDEAGPDETDDFVDLWTRVHEEIGDSDGLILYVEKDDFPLKGALIEVGIALGLDKPITIVLKDVELDEGSMRPIGSWIAHPQCQLCDSLEAAKEWLEKWYEMFGYRSTSPSEKDE